MRKTKTIAYVIGSMDLGGAEKHIVNVACMLKKRGWNPEFFVINSNGPLKKVLENNSIPIHHLPNWCQITTKSKILKFVVLFLFTLMLVIKYRQKKPDITHFFLPVAYVLGATASILSSVKVKIMSRRSLNKYKNNHPILFYIEKHLHKFMTLICGNSKAVIEELRLEGVPDEKLRLMYNGVDTKQYSVHFDKDVQKEILGIKKEALVFVIVANLIPYKGHADLLQALGLIYKKLPKDWVLLCLGRDGGIQNDLYQKAKSLKISNNIRFLGSQPDVSRYLMLSDIGVLSSHEEGFSNAILESMSAGLAMVVTNVGGNAEAVINNETGLVVPAHNPVALSEALLNLSKNHQLRNQMGIAAKARAETVFSLDSSINMYEKLYNEAISISG